MLRGFHMVKHALHCTSKYIRGSSLDDGLHEPQRFGIEVLEPVISGKNYVRVFQVMQILQCSIKTIKWHAFWKFYNSKKLWKHN